MNFEKYFSFGEPCPPCNTVLSKMATLHGRPLTSFRVIDLKEECADRGLPQSGKKQDLVERLEQYILEHEIPDIDEFATGGGGPSNKSRNEDSSDIPDIEVDGVDEENDIIKEYMAMRQSQLKSAMEEAKQVKNASATATAVSDKKEKAVKSRPEKVKVMQPEVVDIDEDDEDIPLVRAPKKTPKKRKEKTISESSFKGAGSQSESDGENMSRAKRDGARLKSPVNYCEDDDSPPPPHAYSATASAAFKKGKAVKMKSPPQTLTIKKVDKPAASPSSQAAAAMQAMASAASPPPKNAAAVVSRIKSPVNYVDFDDDDEDSPPPPQKSHKKAEAAAAMKSPPQSSVTSKKAVNPVNAGNPFSLAMNFSAAKSPPQKAAKEMEKQQPPKAVMSPPPKVANLVVEPQVVSPPSKPANLVVKPPVVSPPPKPQQPPQTVVSPPPKPVNLVVKPPVVSPPPKPANLVVKPPVVSAPPKPQEAPKAVVAPPVLPPKPQEPPKAVVAPPVLPPKPQQLPQAVYSPPPKPQQLPQAVYSPPPKPQQPPKAVFSPPPKPQQAVVSPQLPPKPVFSPPSQLQQPQKVVSSTPKPVNMEKNFMEKQFSPTPLTSTSPFKHAEERKEQSRMMISPFAKTTKPVDEQPLNLVSPPSKPKFEEKPQPPPSSLAPTTNLTKTSEKEPLSKGISIFSPAISMVDQHKAPSPKIIEEKVMSLPIAKSTGNVENLKKMFSQSPAKPVIAKPPQDISHLYRASASDPSKPKEKEQTYAQFMAAKNVQQKEQTPKVTLSSSSPPKPQIVEKAQPLHSIPKPKEIPEKKPEKSSAMFGFENAAVAGGKKNQDLVSNKPTISFQSKPEASKEVKVAAEMDLKTNKCITTAAAAEKEKSVQKITSSRARAASPPQPPRPHPKKAAIAAQPPPAKIDYNKKEAELDETDEILVEENVTFSEVFEEDDDSEEKEDNSPKMDRSKNSPTSIEVPEKPVDKSTFRTMKRLGSTQSNQEKPREKRKWGDSKKSIQPSIDTRKVSSSELKDIIPDIKPVLEEIKHEQEEGQKMETETSDVDSDDVSKEQPAEVLKRAEKTRENAAGEKAFTVTAPASTELLRPLVEDAKDKLTSNSSDKNLSRVVEVRNLVRPFTNNQLINLLKRTGGFDEKIEFWIDKIKSHALVKYASASEAEETVMALDGVKWPSSNQKKLIVTFSSDEHFQRQSVEAVSLSRAASESAQSSLKRSAAGGDRDAHESYGEGRKRPRRDSASMHEADEEDGRDHKEKTASARLTGRGGAAAAGGATATEAEKEAKSLEVLFKKTKALPSIYWMPKADSSSSS